MKSRVLVLGAGFGGLELATLLSDELGAEADVTVIDKGENFVFGFSKLEVAFGKKTLEDVSHPYRDFDKPGVRLPEDTVLDKRLEDFRKKNGGKPPNIFYILIDDIGFGDLGSTKICFL